MLSDLEKEKESLKMLFTIWYGLFEDSSEVSYFLWNELKVVKKGELVCKSGYESRN